MRERQIPMLDHVPNLSLHRDTEQCYEVHDENRPENRNIENVEECADYRNCR